MSASLSYAACAIVTVAPATVMVPVLAPAVLAATSNANSPLPVLDAGATTLSHGTSADADHAQVSPLAVTLRRFTDGPSATPNAAGVTTKVHVPGATG